MGNITYFLYTFINKTYIIIPVIFIVSFLCISGCHDNDGFGPTIVGPDGGQVTTSDGRFILDIPPGALTEDVEITITRDKSFGEDVLVYDAKPDGLDFLIPAILTGDLSDIAGNDPETTNVYIGFNITGDEIEELDEQAYDVDFSNGDAIYSAEVNHFSIVVFIRGALEIKHSNVPDMGMAHSKLVDFNVIVQSVPSPDNNGLPRLGLRLARSKSQSDLNKEIFETLIELRPEYIDNSVPEVIYDRDLMENEKVFLTENIIEEEYETTEPYSCDNPGPGVFRILILVQGIILTVDLVDELTGLLDDV